MFRSHCVVRKCQQPSLIYTQTSHLTMTNETVKVSDIKKYVQVSLEVFYNYHVRRIHSVTELRQTQIPPSLYYEQKIQIYREHEMRYFEMHLNFHSLKVVSR